ncbi:type II secretion system F family protein [Massilia antarctica]|uniref:type II secretion system F family protein n=1 Tax=Massilia antarctica TaxID=2765360 RepID=UPI0006BB69EA|nr:type II secretion system F family protein [Massilia sp. H27-R4]MCY0911947.1 type II secretion system F family protein [Massilia sp. H27-R4]CUI06594.1 Type II/IV secretion system protein TadC, associated with Flp pilus assembly [Janthinobacterium sp. CG23_2]CUU30380.1 Type II/IV secretion system protein TadC, associated with Flp pilus assembly [Janthinobacterium sp. CG23_2]
MSGSQLLFLLIVFAVVVGLAGLAMVTFWPGYMQQRLARVGASADTSAHRSDGWVEKVAKVAQPFSSLSLPEQGWEKSPLRTRFMNAGWRGPAVATLYFGAKTLLALFLPALVGLWIALSSDVMSGQRIMMMLLGTAAFGYYLPNAVLEFKARRRQREIFESIPDALDLLTVCVEAGLSLERALIKVAAEIHIKSMVLAQEMQLVLMEMRAGFSKEKALRNFALRSGVEDVDTLVAMMIQSERFGTSMGTSLRVHADTLRTKRRQMAEEQAAKIGVKLMFPLIFFIFPTLLMVLLGPAAMQIMRTLKSVNGL